MSPSCRLIDPIIRTGLPESGRNSEARISDRATRDTKPATFSQTVKEQRRLFFENTVRWLEALLLLRARVERCTGA
jgi:hypothetical protein